MFRYCVMKELLVVACVVSVSRGLSCSGVSPPVWPKAYSVRGNISVPMAGVNEPFMAYYDETAGNSRIDYWRGNVNTYQSSAEPYGFMQKVAPLAKESFIIKTCVQKAGTASNPVAPQTALPDLSKYKCADIDEINGVQSQKWVYIQNNYMRITKFTMWVTIEQKDNVSVPLPIRFEVKDFNSLLESHHDHYFLIYDLFSSEPPGAHVWKVESGVSCSPFRSTQLRHITRINPIREYIHNIDEYVNDAWEHHKKKFNKKYTGLEELKRRENFKQNRRFVFSVNRAGNGFNLKLNNFADWSQEELDYLKGRKFLAFGNNASVLPDDLLAKDVPVSLDWRLFGAVTPVKDQGLCGNGWAFAATGVLEGANFIKTGILDDLSEQVLMDCSWNYGNNGCDGGDDFRAFRWVMANGGLPKSKDYGSYKTDDGLCHSDDVNSNAPIKGYINVTPNDSTALRVALFHYGPISVAVHASPKSFIFYSSGVYSDPGCHSDQEHLDHYALLAGYGDLNGKSFWLLKNSWSTTWGNNGYILIAVDDNVCGVMTSPTVVMT